MQASGPRSRIRRWFVNPRGSLLAAAIAMALAGCARPHRVQEELTWSETGPGAVRLTFQSAPSHHLRITDAPDFVARLRQHGKPVVRGEFDVYCDWRGIHEMSFDGIPVPPQAGGRYGREGNHLEIGPFAGACQ